MSTTGTGRLTGLDVARYLAFAGMVLVNFRTVMSPEEGSGLLFDLFAALEGRAAATFVVLAGIGLGLAAASGLTGTVSVTIRRAAFLMVLGLANMMVFDADILHYYAVYFLIGALLLSQGSRSLVLIVLLLNLAFVMLLALLDYEAGWDWSDLSYVDFWTVSGFIRHLFFNGWHPVIPWAGFFLAGIVMSRWNLAAISTQLGLLLGGVAAMAMAEGLSAYLIPIAAASDPELALLLTTEPIPPAPLFFLAGVGAASLLVGACLFLSSVLARSGLSALVAPAGRQTLTLYLAHIFLGMGTLDELGLLGGQSLELALSAALVFTAAATAYALLWARWFRHGPAETVMRRLAG